MSFSAWVAHNTSNEHNSSVLMQTPQTGTEFNALKAESYPICHLLALLSHPILHVSRIKVKG